MKVNFRMQRNTKKTTAIKRKKDEKFLESNGNYAEAEKSDKRKEIPLEAIESFKP